MRKRNYTAMAASRPVTTSTSASRPNSDFNSESCTAKSINPCVNKKLKKSKSKPKALVERPKPHTVYYSPIETVKKLARHSKPNPHVSSKIERLRKWIKQAKPTPYKPTTSSDIHCMKEQLCLFGRQIDIVCNHKPEPLPNHNSNNNVLQVANVSFSMSEAEWQQRIARHSDSEAADAFCRQHNLSSLHHNDPFAAVEEPNDYKLVRRIQNDRSPVIKACKARKTCDESDRSLMHQFNAILDAEEDDDNNNRCNAEWHDVCNYRFVDRSFPSRTCLACGAPLRVLVLSHFGDGSVHDRDIEAAEGHSVALYKVTALCRQFPQCLFPLYRPQFAVHWIQTAWFDDRPSSIEKRGKKRAFSDAQSEVKNETSDAGVPQRKKRKIVAEQTQKSGNDYAFLKQLFNAPPSFSHSHSQSRYIPGVVEFGAVNSGVGYRASHSLRSQQSLSSTTVSLQSLASNTSSGSSNHTHNHKLSPVTNITI